MKNKTYIVFVIQGYEEVNNEGALKDVVTFELIDKDAASALKRAEAIEPNKKSYRLSQVIEKYRE